MPYWYIFLHTVHTAIASDNMSTKLSFILASLVRVQSCRFFTEVFCVSMQFAACSRCICV